MTWSSAQERLLGSINKADVFSISTTCSSPWDFVDTKRQLVKKVGLSGFKTSFYGGRMPETPDEPTLPMTGVDPDACLLKDHVSTRWFPRRFCTVASENVSKSVGTRQLRKRAWKGRSGTLWTLQKMILMIFLDECQNTKRYLTY